MIVLTFLTVCQALKWSDTGEPLKKFERKEAKLERRLEKSHARVKESSRRKTIGHWSFKLPFDEGTVGRSKCALRSENQKQCCDNTEVCLGCDPALLARGFSCEEQEAGGMIQKDPEFFTPDLCHCSSSYG